LEMLCDSMQRSVRWKKKLSLIQIEREREVKSMWKSEVFLLIVSVTPLLL